MAIRSGSSRFLRTPFERRAALPTVWADASSRSASVPVAERYLLDTSAVLALTDREDGFQKVEELLEWATSGETEIVVCAVTLMELYYIALQEQGDDLAAQLVGLVKSWPIRWIYPDEKVLLHAGRIKAFHRLSFADAIIAAVARLHEAVLVHKDPESETLAAELSLLNLPYK
jgi:predicted nucleic acid-binding protein